MWKNGVGLPVTISLGIIFYNDNGNFCVSLPLTLFDQSVKALIKLQNVMLNEI